MPIALVRSAGSGNSTAISPRAAGAASASPTPCTNRLDTSIAEFAAAPLVNDATANTATPVRNMRRRPSRSLNRPPSSNSPPAISA
jgi:hypothetical protein